MPDITVSSDIDSFMQSTSRQAAMDNLAGATTSGRYLRGNGTDVVMAQIQAADVPTLNQNTTGTAAGLSSTLAVGSGGTGATTLASGGYLKGAGAAAITSQSGIPAGDITSGTLLEARGDTGQTTYTNGQLLIGNAAGGLTKATLSAGANVNITNGDGAITIESTGGGAVPGAYWEFFEHFMSTTLSGNLALAVTGGTNTLVNSGFGIVAMSTGTSAVANQQSRLNQAATNAVTNGTAAARAIFRFAQGGVTWFDGTLTGALRCGWGDSTTGESSNGIYFRVQDGQGIDFVTRASNIETLTSTGVSFANGVFRNMEILINSAGNQVIAKIDGTTVATHTTNIPSARLIFFSHINRTSTTGTAVNANLDLVYSRITPNTPFFS